MQPSNGLPVERPKCATAGHGYMQLRSPGTKEQAYCGTWYDCGSVWPNTCRSSVLLMSPALIADLAAQKGLLAKATLGIVSDVD